MGKEITSFVDPGVTGRDFTRFFLQSAEFPSLLLSRFLERRIPKSKEAKAWAVADLVLENPIAALDVISSYAKRPKGWFSLKLGNAANQLPELDDPSKLLYEFGTNNWYGPIQGDSGRAIYLRPFEIPHLVDVGGKYTRRRIRWVIVAELAPQWMSLAWNGFTQRSDVDGGLQFPFWKYVPDAFQELEALLGGTWNHPLLHDIVLRQLWELYVDNPSYHWQHLRVRAEASGVALNAKSARVKDLNVQGLERLSSALSLSVIKALNLAPDAKASTKAGSAILRTLIQEWGTNSYEFSLSQLSQEEPTDLFHAHCYFGLRPQLRTQDALQHLRSYAQSGGSTAARSFLLSQIGL